MIGKAACFVLMVNSVVWAGLGVLCLALLIFTPPIGMLRITWFFASGICGIAQFGMRWPLRSRMALAAPLNLSIIGMLALDMPDLMRPFGMFLFMLVSMSFVFVAPLLLQLGILLRMGWALRMTQSCV